MPFWQSSGTRFFPESVDFEILLKTSFILKTLIVKIGVFVFEKQDAKILLVFFLCFCYNDTIQDSF